MENARPDASVRRNVEYVYRATDLLQKFCARLQT